MGVRCTDKCTLSFSGTRHSVVVVVVVVAVVAVVAVVVVVVVALGVIFVGEVYMRWRCCGYSNEVKRGGDMVINYAKSELVVCCACCRRDTQ